MLRWLNFIIEFRGQAVKARHWRQIEEVLGVEFGDQLPLTLASLMSINAIEKQKTLHVILNKARAEMNVQSEFDEVGLVLCFPTEEEGGWKGNGEMQLIKKRKKLLHTIINFPLKMYQDMCYFKIKLIS